VIGNSKPRSTTMIDAVAQEVRRSPTPRLVAVIALALGAWLVVAAIAWAILKATSLI
jgi:hypothetical protein